MNFLKLTLSVFIITGFAACASVTDANLDAQEPAAAETAAADNTENEDGDVWYNSNGDDMDPIVDRPPSPRGN